MASEEHGEFRGADAAVRLISRVFPQKRLAIIADPILGCDKIILLAFGAVRWTWVVNFALDVRFKIQNSSSKIKKGSGH
jgi:hypothetical protein